MIPYSHGVGTFYVNVTEERRVMEELELDYVVIKLKKKKPSAKKTSE